MAGWFARRANKRITYQSVIILHTSSTVMKNRPDFESLEGKSVLTKILRIPKKCHLSLVISVSQFSSNLRKTDRISAISLKTCLCSMSFAISFRFFLNAVNLMVITFVFFCFFSVHLSCICKCMHSYFFPSPLVFNVEILVRIISFKMFTIFF